MRDRRARILAGSVGSVLLVLLGCGKGKDDAEDLNYQAYVGSDKCAPCHGPYPSAAGPFHTTDGQATAHGKSGNTTPSDASVLADANNNGQNDFKDGRNLGVAAPWTAYGAFAPVLGFDAGRLAYTARLGPRTFDVAKVIGAGRHKQLYLTSTGNSLYVLPVLYDTAAKSWQTFQPEDWYTWNDTDGDGLIDGGEAVTGVRYASPSDTPETLGRTGDSWEANCVGCHVTGLTSLQRNGGGEFVAQSVEDGAGCESCHGPGRIHVLTLGGKDFADRAIVNPARLSAADQEDVCKSCHARGRSTGAVGGATLDFPWRPDGTAFRPGQILADAFTPGDKALEPLHRLQGTHLHSGAAGSKYGAWSTTCLDCHQAHFTAPNLSLVRPTVRGRTVVFTKRSGPAPGSMGDATDGAYTDICEVCHTQTTHFRNNLSTPVKTHNNGAICTDCHPHWRGFPNSESSGGQDCSACHSDLVTAMTSTSGARYHHVLQSSGVGYPTLPTGKTCLSCHADHDIFSPTMNPTDGGRGRNLRTAIAQVPTTTTGFTNTDFINAGSGGICLSCHTAALAKGVVPPDGTTTTPAIPYAGAALGVYNSSPHGGAYAVTSTFSDTGTNTFLANCSKCHNDTLNPKSDKAAQTGAFAFGNHESTLGRILAPLGIAAPAGPLEENFCYRCHSRLTDAVDGTAKAAAGRDWYDAASMSARAEGIFPLLAGASPKTFRHAVGSASGKHRPVEGTSYNWNPAADRHVECADCHNPHAAGTTRAFDTSGTFAQPTAPTNAVMGPLQGVWGVNVPVWPAAWTVPAPASGYSRVENSAYEWQVCIKCHSGYAYNTTRPAGQTDVTQEFNPNNASYHAVIGASKATGGTYVSPWTAASAMSCSDCHTTDVKTEPQGPHGSAVDAILAGPYTTGTGAAGTQAHLCFKCHDYSTYVNGGGTTNFRDGGKNLHVEHMTNRNRRCMNCHAAVPHGFNRRALVVFTGDPAPYDYGDTSAQINSLPNGWRTPGNWKKGDCSTTGICH